MFGKEKATAFQKILNEILHREPKMMFLNPNASQDEIVKNKNFEYKVSARRVSGITFIRYAQNRKIRKPNYLKICEQ